MDHLAVTSKMLNLYVATGHINYAKSVRLYLQMTINLKHDYPWLHVQFAEIGYHSVWRTSKHWAGLWRDLVIEQIMMRSVKSIGGLTRGRGMIQSVRDLWVSTLHSYGVVEQSMREITGTPRLSSEQHVEFGSTRCNRDFDNLTKVYLRFQQFNLFNIKDERLRFLSSELAVKPGDQVNCDDAESVGRKIQEQIDNVAVTKAKVPRSKKVRNLLQLTKAIKISTHDVYIDPAILFIRLLVLVERSDDPVSYFQYELTRYPASIFHGDYMKHVNKALLGHEITDKKKERPKSGKNRKCEETKKVEDE